METDVNTPEALLETATTALQEKTEALETANAEVTRLTTEHATLTADLAHANTTLETVNAALGLANTEKATLQGKLVTAEQAVTDFNAKVSLKAAGIASANGAAPVNVTPAKDGSKTPAAVQTRASREALWAKCQAIADPTERRAFYEANLKG